MLTKKVLIYGTIEEHIPLKITIEYEWINDNDELVDKIIKELPNLIESKTKKGLIMEEQKKFSIDDVLNGLLVLALHFESKDNRKWADIINQAREYLRELKEIKEKTK